MCDSHPHHAAWGSCAQAPEKQQLHKGAVLLEDAKRLADLKVENDDVLAVSFMQEGQ